MLTTQTNQMIEIALTASGSYAAPDREVELDAVITTPSGKSYTRPGYWAGGGDWRVRLAPDEVGVTVVATRCSVAGDAGLHGQTFEIDVRPYRGDNTLLTRGPLRVSADHRRLAHADGAPFFWLADTWWMGLCSRLRFPDEFETLLMDRVEKGFTAVQIVAGLYPDMDPFDPRGANEAGYPWDTEFSRINPAYFDLADQKIARLVEAGISPCIVGCWGYYLHAAGPEAIRRHWRYLVARWGAYPVTWCLAGEVLMPHYTQEFADDAARAKHVDWLYSEWSAVGRYVREIDCARHPITAHPGGRGESTRQMVDEDVFDFVWLQTGHFSPDAYAPTRKAIREDYEAQPVKPVINSEVCYEGIMESCRQEAQRYLFWTCLLDGAAGHTYGANGIWQLNQEGKPYGPSPHGLSWGDLPWTEAYQLPGSKHVGVGKAILTRYPWWQFTPQPEWVDMDVHEIYKPAAAGIPGQVRVIYWPNALSFAPPTIRGIEAGVRYSAKLVDPIDGSERPLGIVEPDADGQWKPPFRFTPRAQDWVFVLEAGR